MHIKTKAVIPARLSARGVPGEDLPPSPCMSNPKPRPPQGPWDPGSRWDAHTDAGSGLFPNALDQHKSHSSYDNPHKSCSNSETETEMKSLEVPVPLLSWRSSCSTAGLNYIRRIMTIGK